MSTARAALSPGTPHARQGLCGRADVRRPASASATGVRAVLHRRYAVDLLRVASALCRDR